MRRDYTRISLFTFMVLASAMGCGFIWLVRYLLTDLL